MMADSVCLSLPPKADFLIVARLSAAAVAGRAGLDMEQIEDVRTAVAEACLWLLPRCAADGHVHLTFSIENGLDVVAAIDDARDTEESQEAMYSRYLIEALMDEVRWPERRLGRLEMHLFKRLTPVEQ